jgi:NADH-quinone oxidoreductase subunit G
MATQPLGDGREAALTAHLLLHSELSVYGACRMCVVRTPAHRDDSCSTQPADGMVIAHHAAAHAHPQDDAGAPSGPSLPRLHHLEKNGKCNSRSKRTVLAWTASASRQGAHQMPDLSTPSIVRDNDKCILVATACACAREVQAWAP